MQYLEWTKKMQVYSDWMYFFNVSREVWKNFKATNESLFKANTFTANEICVNFQPFLFFWRVKGSNNLEKLICSGYSCRKTIPCTFYINMQHRTHHGEWTANEKYIFIYFFTYFVEKILCFNPIHTQLNRILI